MKLTELKIKSLKTKDKRYRVSDGNGLSLLVSTGGAKQWQYRYNNPTTNKQETISLGCWPAVSLAEARERHRELWVMVKVGQNPKGEELSSDTFEAVAREWFKSWKRGKSEAYALDMIQRIEKNLLPEIGHLPIAEIKAKTILEALQKMQKRGVIDTAHRMKQVASQIFKYAIIQEICENDPTLALDGLLETKPVEHYAFTSDPQKLGEILRSIDDYEGHWATRLALKMAPYVFLRPTELAGLRWEEVFLEEKILKIQAKRMKMKKPHYVPLATQSLEIIRAAKEIGRGEFVFPSPLTNERSINESSLRIALRRCGIAKEEQTTHGFRHTASTILNEQGYPHDIIELQLAHGDKDQIRATYNHAQRLEDRRKLMQEYADFLDGMK